MKSIIRDSIRNRAPTTIEKRLLEEDAMSDSIDSKLEDQMNVNMQTRLASIMA